MALFKIIWQPSKAELHDYLQVENVYYITILKKIYLTILKGYVERKEKYSDKIISN